MINTHDHGGSYIEQDVNPIASSEDPGPAMSSSLSSSSDVQNAPDDADGLSAVDPKPGNPTIAANSLPPVIDGKESVEFQIGIHVVDMFDILASRAPDARSGTSRRHQLVRHVRDATANILRSSPSTTTLASSETEFSQRRRSATSSSSNSDNPAEAREGIGAAGADVTLTEVLDSLQYVVDYRLKGRQQPHLDASLMRRLCDALLLIMALMQGSFLHKRLTDDARAAYFLFGQFIEEVNEFQLCVGQKPTADLRRALLLHKRITDGGPEEERMALVTIIRLVLACMAPGHDWRDLVDEHEQRALAPVVEKYNRIIDEDTTSYHMPVTGGVIYPPPSLYFDRAVEKLVAMFKTDAASGLTSEQVAERREFYGRNELPRPVRRPWWMIVWAQLTDLMILMLCAAIVATAVDGEWKSSIVLAVVVVLNTIIGAWQEIKAGKALSA
ncbi:hypothetical protein H4R20_004295, partial [Coemansia guatemalensis]